jgi:mRNA-degrading endonuclease toxin of MazEF toxin-antitoxin module
LVTGPRRGEIWWGDTPDEKPRPYLVLTRSTAIPGLRRLVAAPITGNGRGVPSEVRLGFEDGLAKECVASFDNVGTIRKAYLVRRMCVLGPDRMAEACDALRAAVDC